MGLKFSLNERRELKNDVFEPFYTQHSSFYTHHSLNKKKHPQSNFAMRMLFLFRVSNRVRTDDPQNHNLVL
jgi:hypothetical protein